MADDESASERFKRELVAWCYAARARGVDGEQIERAVVAAVDASITGIEDAVLEFREQTGTLPLAPFSGRPSDPG